MRAFSIESEVSRLLVVVCSVIVCSRDLLL
jgi:hypothetical protein